MVKVETILFNKHPFKNHQELYTMKTLISGQKYSLAAMFMLLIFTFTCTMTGCQASRTAKGAAIGAAAGGVVGGVVGKKAGNTAVGAIIGAAVGGTAGALIGRHMDKQAEELRRDLEGATVERVGEGILITFNSGLQFDLNSYNLTATTRGNLDDFARVVNKYDDTDILIEGHTDSSGSDDYNQTLSEKRAESVKRHLISQGVVANRLTSVGYGESQPIADNDTQAGRQQNRRVEVAIYANNRMKRAAKRGEL